MNNVSWNYMLLKDKYDGELGVVTYEDTGFMFTDISKQICFSDCDDSFEILQIIYQGKEVVYGGWKPGMHYTFYYKDTKDLVYENWFPQWDH